MIDSNTDIDNYLPSRGPSFQEPAALGQLQPDGVDSAAVITADAGDWGCLLIGDRTSPFGGCSWTIRAD